MGNGIAEKTVCMRSERWKCMWRWRKCLGQESLNSTNLCSRRLGICGHCSIKLHEARLHLTRNILDAVLVLALRAEPGQNIEAPTCKQESANGTHDALPNHEYDLLGTGKAQAGICYDSLAWPNADDLRASTQAKLAQLRPPLEPLLSRFPRVSVLSASPTPARHESRHSTPAVK